MVKKVFITPVLHGGLTPGSGDLPALHTAQGDLDGESGGTPSSYSSMLQLYGSSFSESDYIEWWTTMYALDPASFSLDRFNELNAELQGDWNPSRR